MYTPTSVVENTPNFVGNVRIRRKQHSLLFWFLVEINLILGAWYLYWRITDSVNFNALWLSVPLLLAEVYSYVGGVIFFIGLWRPLVHQTKSLDQLTPPLPLDEMPTVDILITCYNEPIEIIEETTRAALGIDYPVTKLAVYVLDNDHSHQVREMVQRLAASDLRSPQLQEVRASMEAARSRLLSQQQQLEYLIPEVSEAEEFLARFHYSTITDLSAFKEVLAWFDDLQPHFVPMRTWLECQTALAEAFSNAVEHAHHQKPSTTKIDIEVALFTYSIQMRIMDYGLPFDLGKSLQNLPQPGDKTAERGRGLQLLQKIADYLHYAPLPDGRNCFLLIKSYTPEEKQDSTLDQLSSYLQSLRQTLRLLNPCDPNLRDHLLEQKQLLDQEICRRDSALKNLSRCRYIARPQPQDRPHHAEADDINYTIFLEETSGDFILNLDADHIPKPHFLKRVLPYFYTYNPYSSQYDSNQVAFVQTPQAFYNLPADNPFEHSANLCCGPMQQGKDGMNVAFYPRNNAVLRREALIGAGLKHFTQICAQDESRLNEFELIGGVSGNSIAEEINTAMRLHNAGWKSVYHHEILAEGLAPNDLSSTLKQQLRWAQETIQALLREIPWNKPGLSFWEQWQYFQTMYSYFSGFFTLIFIACPIIYFFTGVIPVDVYGYEFTLHFAPTFIVNRLTFMVASWGIPAREAWRSEQYIIALFPLFIQAVWSGFTERPTKFQVTPKQHQAEGYLHLVLPQIVIFVLTLAGLAWSIYLLIVGELENSLALVVNATWAIYNLSLLWVIVRVAHWQPQDS